MELKQILQYAVNQNAADIFIVAGQPVTIKTYHQLRTIDDHKLTPNDTEALIHEIYGLALGRPEKRLIEKGDDDFSFSVSGLSRFRVNTYKQRGSYAAVIRIISFDLPNPQDIGIDQSIIELVNIKKGLILVTGPAGSGKSTTQACMIDYINQTQSKHIITLEDPLEYLHSHKKSIVSQREISIDSDSYVSGLKATLRQAPDVILLGEMRDYETINVALTAAETGHTIISTLHTLGTATTIDRIIDVFPATQQRQVALQLSMTLEVVISQQLVPTIEGTLIPVFEIMKVTPAIRNLIRENKTHQIDGVIASNKDMVSMEDSLYQLVQKGIITQETAMLYCTNQDIMKRKLNIR